MTVLSKVRVRIDECWSQASSNLTRCALEMSFNHDSIPTKSLYELWINCECKCSSNQWLEMSSASRSESLSTAISLKGAGFMKTAIQAESATTSVALNLDKPGQLMVDVVPIYICRNGCLRRDFAKRCIWLLCIKPTPETTMVLSWVCRDGK